MKAILLLASVALLAAAASAASARPPHRHARRAAAAAAPGSATGAGERPAEEQFGRHGSFNAGAAQVPPQGYYDSYQGPGSTVLKRGLAAQNEPGAAEELSPGAKQTATGGPAGGLPGFGGGM